jgi:periplasmic protein CpxP/Spy
MVGCDWGKVLGEIVFTSSNNFGRSHVCSSRLNRRRNTSGIDAERELPMKMMMNRRYAMRLGALALCSAALCTAPMLAQGGGGGRQTPEQQLATLTTTLNLTPDQTPKVKAILDDSAKQMTDLRNSGGDMTTMRPKMMAIRTDQQTKIKALLTDDQKTKYDAMIAAQAARMGGGGGAPPPPPPPAQ